RVRGGESDDAARTYLPAVRAAGREVALCPGAGIRRHPRGQLAFTAADFQIGHLSVVASCGELQPTLLHIVERKRDFLARPAVANAYRLRAEIRAQDLRVGVGSGDKLDHHRTWIPSHVQAGDEQTHDAEHED